MRRTRRGLGLIVGVMVLSLVAAACGSSSKKAGTTGANAKVPKGGTLVLSAEQELDCADFIATCGNSLWGSWTVGEQVLPRAYDVDTQSGKQVPSILLTGEATLETSPKQKLTYKINPKAVWSDNAPITSADFKYTWDQIMHGKGIYDTTGYKNIETVDTPDDHTVVVTFAQPYPDWKALFGGFYGVLPNHLLQGKDRSTEMKDGFKWSGGPWMLDHWTKGQEIKLVPNPTYWGAHPNLDAIVFKIITDTAAETQAFKTGQIAAMFPQIQLDQASLKTLPDTTLSVPYNFNYEAIWFNTSKPVVSDKAVRQALSYATDRDLIVSQLFGPVAGPSLKPINSFTTPANKEWYEEPFSKYKRDLTKVNDTMTAAGWAKGADGIWAKGGQKANITMRTTTGNKRRELTEQILQSQWKEAGFGLAFDNQKSGVLFGQTLPAGDFQLALFAQTPTDNDPGQCTNFCKANIPTSTNQSGANYTRTDDAQIDSLWTKIDQEIDPGQRKSDVTAANKLLADFVPALPVDPLADVIIYNSAKLGGPIAGNPVYGMYSNMQEWFCKTPAC